MANPLIIGDRVAYARTFLESGAIERSERWLMSTRRGIVTAIDGGWLAHVAWSDGGSRSHTINIANICRPRSIAFVESMR